MFGSDGATATSPMEIVDWWSKTGIHVPPLLVVFHSPPDAEAMYLVAGFVSTTAISVIRPPIVAGPSGRAVKSLISAAASTGSRPVPLESEALTVKSRPARMGMDRHQFTNRFMGQLGRREKLAVSSN